MCIGTNERGGPYRCSGHMRAARDKARGRVENVEKAVADNATQIAEREQAQAAILTSEASGDNAFLALLHDPKEILPTDSYNRYHELETELAGLHDRRAALAAERDRDQQVLDQCEDDYRATRQGIGEAMRDLQRLESAPVDPESRHLRMLALRRGLADIQKAENRMAEEGFARQQRWGTSDKPVVRGAETGAQTTLSGTARLSAAGILVHEADIHGSYNNTFTPDPDGMEGPNSPGSGDRAIRHSRMEIVRPDGDERRRMTVPMHTPTTYGDTSGPTVRKALLSAVDRAERYTPDYATWAKENGYDATDRGWTGSQSYSFGREAHKEARHLKVRVRRFLDQDEYKMLAEETRDLAYS